MREERERNKEREKRYQGRKKDGIEKKTEREKNRKI